MDGNRRRYSPAAEPWPEKPGISTLNPPPSRLRPFLLLQRHPQTPLGSLSRPCESPRWPWAPRPDLSSRVSEDGALPGKTVALSLEYPRDAEKRKNASQPNSRPPRAGNKDPFVPARSLSLETRVPWVWCPGGEEIGHRR